MVRKSAKVVNQVSLFDQMDLYKGGYVVCQCKFDKTNKNWCKNWDGKGSSKDAEAAIHCPEKINEDNASDCKHYVIGKPCKNFRKGK
jgi:hypothetical protein